MWNLSCSTPCHQGIVVQKKSYVDLGRDWAKPGKKNLLSAVKDRCKTLTWKVPVWQVAESRGMPWGRVAACLSCSNALPWVCWELGTE